MGGGIDRVLGLASIGVGFLATVVLAVAVSTDYWLYTDEPADIALAVQEPHDSTGDDDHSADEVVTSSTVTMISTNSGLWRICVYSKDNFTGNILMLSTNSKMLFM